jgi:serine/threonine protein kinase
MVDESGNPRITDFGLAAIARNPDSRRTTSGEDRYTARWCAPELLIGGQSAPKESDIFSLGMIMIEVGSDGFVTTQPSHT